MKMLFLPHYSEPLLAQKAKFCLIGLWLHDKENE